VSLSDRLGGDLRRTAVTLDLDDIQATVLRYRPEPYYGTHVLGQISDARGGREVLRRLVPHIASAAGWWLADDAWIAVAISYPGLVALGVPEASLQSFPEAFRAGMAARAEQLFDYGVNAPQNWDPPFGSGQVHIAVSIFSGDEDRWRRAKLVGRWRSGAPLTLAPEHDDPALGADPQRNDDFNYANDPHGKQVPLGAHMRHESARYRAGTAHGCEPAPHHPAQHDLRRTLRPECHLSP
jgi:deferrochelatase/peroxidase EfeB